MSSKDNIYHSGIVEKVDGVKVVVRILQQTACGECHAKNFCSISDMKEKKIDAVPPAYRQLKVGDEVSVIMEKAMGMKAILLAYVIPLFLLMTTLVTLWYTTGQEALTALMSLLVLVPYYVIIYFNREKLKKEFVFRIK